MRTTAVTASCYKMAKWRAKCITSASFIACLHCDLLQCLPELAPGASARCLRCKKERWRRREGSLNRTLALTLAAAVLYVAANTVPMLGLTIGGPDALEQCVDMPRIAALAGLSLH
jgi:uncharacterized paraquat-inducible protein A